MDKHIESRLKELITLAGETVSKAEILASFQKITDYVKKIEQKNLDEIESMHETLTKLAGQIDSKASSNIDQAKQDALDLCKSEMDKMMTSHEEMMKSCEDKMSEMKDGEDADAEKCAREASKLALDALKPLIPTIEAIENDLPKLGEKIVDSINLLPTDNDEDKIGKEHIRGLQEELDKIRQMKAGGSMGAIRIQSTCSGWVTPTGDLDGANKTFTVTGTPLPNTGEVQLNGQGYYDFTVSGSTYTLTDAPQSTDLLKVRHWL